MCGNKGPAQLEEGGKNTVACLCLKFWIFLSIMDSFVLIKMFLKNLFPLITASTLKYCVPGNCLIHVTLFPALS